MQIRLSVMFLLVLAVLISTPASAGVQHLDPMDSPCGDVDPDVPCFSTVGIKADSCVVRASQGQTCRQCTRRYRSESDGTISVYLVCSRTTVSAACYCDMSTLTCYPGGSCTYTQ